MANHEIISTGNEALRLLLQTRDLLDELLETINIMADDKLVELIGRSEKGIKEEKPENSKFISEIGYPYLGV